jgi:hypothetical protein
VTIATDVCNYSKAKQSKATHTHIHTHTYIHTYTHTHTYTNTLTHTHGQVIKEKRLPQVSSSVFRLSFVFASSALTF